MNDTHREREREADPDIEEITAKLGRLSIIPAPMPSLVVSKPSTDIELNLKSGRRMAFRVGKG